MLWGWNGIDGQLHLLGVICVAEKVSGTSEHNAGGASKVNFMKTYKTGFGAARWRKKSYDKRGRRRRRRDHEVGINMEGRQGRGPAEGRTVFRTSKRQGGGGRQGGRASLALLKCGRRWGEADSEGEKETVWNGRSD